MLIKYFINIFTYIKYMSLFKGGLAHGIHMEVRQSHKEDV